MANETNLKVTPDQLKAWLSTTALSFRGYNQTNLGRSAELLKHAKYGEVVAEYLTRAGRVCAEATGRPADLIARVRSGKETTLESYAEAVALLVGMELAQLRLLHDFFNIDYRQAQVSIGFSLGEVAAVVAGGLLEMEDALRVPLSLSDDCIALAHEVSLAVVFSREQRLPIDEMQRICLEICREGQGAIGISTILAPNSLLVLGQGTTMERFRQQVNATFPKKVFIRINQGDWPPLHTCIVWQKSIANRSADLMQKTPYRMEKPIPPVLSLVTGKLSYDRLNTVDLLHQWVDHPQRLWDAIYESLVMGVETYLHVGPDPNIVPATLRRLKENVEAQAKSSFGVRALFAAAHRRWLQAMLPQRTALLRAASLRQINLEDWLLEQNEFAS